MLCALLVVAIYLNYIRYQITMNGPEAITILRESLSYKGVIIGITGNALPADISTFLMSGADEVLIKPLTRKKLLDSLQFYQTVV